MAYHTLIYSGIEYPKYEINKKGIVRNAETKFIYKQYLNKAGYYVITLPMGKRGKVKMIKVHRALAETFIPNPNNYDSVNHIDCNKENNKLYNLEWCDHITNTKLYYKNKELKSYLKKKPYFNNRKLTRKDVDFIRTHPQLSIKTLAKIFDTSTTTISNARNFVYYK